jgi:thermostable 8-oxoguanine DNA glycosylase
MIDPFNITKYDRTDAELEEFALFCIAAAGKSAATMATALDRMLNGLGLSGLTPLKIVRLLGDRDQVAKALHQYKITPHTQKGAAMYDLAFSPYDLRTCSLAELEGIKWIGRKTSRLFLLHTRPNAEVAVLDTHILKFLRERGYKAPMNTPSGAKLYQELERAFIKEAHKDGKTIAQMDLEVWSRFAKKGVDSVSILR